MDDGDALVELVREVSEETGLEIVGTIGAISDKQPPQALLAKLRSHLHLKDIIWLKFPTVWHENPEVWSLSHDDDDKAVQCGLLLGIAGRQTPPHTVLQCTVLYTVLYILCCGSVMHALCMFHYDFDVVRAQLTCETATVAHYYCNDCTALFSTGSFFWTCAIYMCPGGQAKVASLIDVN